MNVQFSLDEANTMEEEDGVTFSQEDFQLIYGKGYRKINKEPSLVQTSVTFSRFGKLESLASKETRKLYPRLKSIYLDSFFVQRVRDRFPEFKAYANLRNGKWYFRTPADGECRFRSSDGHSRSWSFHASRANIPFLKELINLKGALLVDSTRSGKRYPDSFTRTIPLWCTIINRAIGFPNAQIQLPPWSFPSEKLIINTEKIEEWVGQVKKLLENENLDFFKSPLKPLWIANDQLEWGVQSFELDELVKSVHSELNSIPIVCVSASAQVSPEKHRERYSWPYIPGAADDEENWANGLTANIFWANSLKILENSETCELVVEDVILNVNRSWMDPGSDKILNTFHVAPMLKLIWNVKDSVDLNNARTLDLRWLHGKDKAWARKNSKAWQNRALPDGLSQFYQLRSFLPQSQCIEDFIICSQDVEVALTMAIAITAVFYDERLKLVESINSNIEKKDLKQREAFVTNQFHGVSIERRLMKELTEYFTGISWKRRLLGDKTEGS